LENFILFSFGILHVYVKKWQNILD
jgi:hypothetical protein